jgi:hypothetical protein
MSSTHPLENLREHTFMDEVLDTLQPLVALTKTGSYENYDRGNYFTSRQEEVWSGHTSSGVPVFLLHKGDFNLTVYFDYTVWFGVGVQIGHYTFHVSRGTSTSGQRVQVLDGKWLTPMDVEEAARDVFRLLWDGLLSKRTPDSFYKHKIPPTSVWSVAMPGGTVEKIVRDQFDSDEAMVRAAKALDLHRFKAWQTATVPLVWEKKPIKDWETVDPDGNFALSAMTFDRARTASVVLVDLFKTTAHRQEHEAMTRDEMKATDLLLRAIRKCHLQLLYLVHKQSGFHAHELWGNGVLVAEDAAVKVA